MSIESMMPSNHLILCHPLLLMPSVFPGISVFSHELALIRDYFMAVGLVTLSLVFLDFFPCCIPEVWDLEGSVLDNQGIIT